MTTKKECARPTCTRIKHTAGRGYCLKHAEVLGIIKPFVPRNKALAAVEEKLAQGHTLYSLANAAGLSHTAIYKFAAGPDTWGTDGMKQDTYQAILNAPLRTTYAPAWPSIRRVQSLRAAGHTMQELVDGSGVSQNILTKLSFRNPERVSYEVHEKITDYYRRHVADPVRPVTQKIAKHRWPLPMEWWDIDDPQERRGLLTKAQTNDRITMTADIVDAAQWLADYYGAREAASEGIGVSRPALSHILNGQRGKITREVAHRVTYMAGKTGWAAGSDLGVAA